jgi:hypothetical protein
MCKTVKELSVYFYANYLHCRVVFLNLIKFIKFLTVTCIKDQEAVLTLLRAPYVGRGELHTHIVGCVTQICRTPRSRLR